MATPIAMAEVWRGGLLESLHHGHAVICDETGQIVQAWGDPDAVIYPRSSCKMVQALPLISSGAADRQGLGTAQLALACASHNGAAIHTNRVQAWLRDLGLDDHNLLCGPQLPDDVPARDGLIRSGAAPCQMHNNCSGKHAGFLTLSQYMGAGADYVAIDHPVQQAVLDAFQQVTGQDSPGYGIDGCSAPNFQTTLYGLARAMAWFASADQRADRQSAAAARLTRAMMAHPDMVAGEGRACTELMRAMSGHVAIKTGAEGVFVAILPERRLGVALKITDGATRASECAITAILCGLGVLDPDHPAARQRKNTALTNRRGLVVGSVRPAPDLASYIS